MTSPDDPYGQPVAPPDPAPTPPAGYPQYAWYPWPPPKQRTSPWVWVAVAAIVVLGIGPLLLSGLFFVGLAGTGFDDDYSDEDGYYVSQGSVIDAIEGPCRDLQDEAASLRFFGTVTAGRTSVAALADRSRAIAAAIDDAGPDEPARQMSADWAALAASLDDYAAALGRDATTEFVMPQTNGDYVSTRIYDGNDECFVPGRVAALDPDADAARALDF